MRLWEWNFRWRRELRVREVDLFNMFLEVVSRFIPSKEKKDTWRWQLNSSGI